MFQWNWFYLVQCLHFVLTIHHHYIKPEIEILFFANMIYKQYWPVITAHFKLHLHELNFFLAFALSCPWSISPCFTWLTYPYYWLLHLKQLLFFLFKFSCFFSLTVQTVTYECSILASHVRVRHTIEGCLSLGPLWLLIISSNYEMANWTMLTGVTYRNGA